MMMLAMLSWLQKIIEKVSDVVPKDDHLDAVGLFCAGPPSNSARLLVAACKHNVNAIFASAALAVHCTHLPAQRSVVKAYW